MVLAACALAPACSLVFPVHDDPLPTAALVDAAPAGDAGGDSGARLLFRSGFEGDVRLNAPFECNGGNCKQAIVGGVPPDQMWPLTFWGGTGAMQLFAGGGINVTEQTIGDYMRNEIVDVTGHGNESTRALHQVREQGVIDAYNYIAEVGSGTPSASQRDLYVAHWMKLNEDVKTQVASGNFRQLFLLYQEDVYLGLLLVSDGKGSVVWSLQRKRDQELLWEETSTQKIPSTSWFKLELFFRRQAPQSEGRVWVAVDGEQIIQLRGGLGEKGDYPVDSLRLFANGGVARSEQWVDDLEIWDGFPSTAAAH